MAAPTPALTNTSSDAAATTSSSASAAPPPPPASAASASAVNRTDTPQKTLRGLNKPKCKQCGNVARSRCPYESCKSCCAKAQNPCHIHVLKANVTFPDKAQSSSPLFDQQSTDASSSINSQRVASFRQLSNTFSQFNSVQIPLRSKKPLTRKDAAAINEWRFAKLKEYKERNIEVENDAFDRYIQNVSLLEEVFSTNTHPNELLNEDDPSMAGKNPTLMEDVNTARISGLKLKLRSDPVRTSNFRKRIKQIVDQGLEKLQKFEVDDCNDEVLDLDELGKGPEKTKDRWAERASALSDLIDKLNKARNEEDLKSCLELKSQLYNNKIGSQPESNVGLLTEQTAKSDLALIKGTNYLFPMFTSTEIDQETLVSLNTHFSSLEQVENL